MPLDDLTDVLHAMVADGRLPSASGWVEDFREYLADIKIRQLLNCI
jgi:hypothetical protein